MTPSSSALFCMESDEFFPGCSTEPLVRRMTCRLWSYPCRQCTRSEDCGQILGKKKAGNPGKLNEIEGIRSARKCLQKQRKSPVAQGRTGLFHGVWRRERDSNPRNLAVHTLSRRVPSTARTSLRSIRYQKTPQDITRRVFSTIRIIAGESSAFP